MRLETLELQTGRNPSASIVVLHGLGADGSDFVPIAQQLDLSAVGPVRYVFPHAPVRAVTLNAGMHMRAWYDLVGIDLVAREDEGGLRASLALVQELLDHEAERGVPPARIVLMGFSQGCALSLLTGLRTPRRLAGLAGLSGYLPLAARTETERSAANRDVPVFLAHGRMDPLVPIARGRETRDALLALGYRVEWHEYPMEHTVCEAELADLNAWLLRVLAVPAS